jgi:hypothetical protein
MQKESAQLNRQHVISASEVGEYAYCAKAWYLKRCGAAAQGEHLAAGTAFHTRHGNEVARVARLKRASNALVLLALLLLIALCWLLVAMVISR